MNKSYGFHGILGEGEFSDINFIHNKNKKPKKYFTQFS